MAVLPHQHGASLGADTGIVRLLDCWIVGSEHHLSTISVSVKYLLTCHGINKETLFYRASDHP